MRQPALTSMCGDTGTEDLNREVEWVEGAGDGVRGWVCEGVRGWVCEGVRGEGDCIKS